MAGAVAAAIRNTNYYSDLFSGGARLALEFVGTKTGKPFYGYDNRVLNSYANIPGWTFTRASTGYAEGLVDDVVTNKVTAWNANPTEAAGFVGTPFGMLKGGDAAAVLSVVNDVAALAAAGLSGVCTSGKVYKLDNTAGSTAAFCNTVGPCGNTNNHSVSSWARGAAGILGIGAGGSTGFAASGPYVRRTHATPGVAPNSMFIGANAGAVVYFILPQLIERPAAISQDIVTEGAAASAVVGRVNGYVSFASGVPAITSKGLSVWESRTNLCLQSNTPSDASWNKNACSVGSAVLGPDAVLSAYPITESTAGSLLRNITAITIASGSTYAISRLVRRGNCDWIRILAGDDTSFTNSVRIWFNMATGTVGTAGVLGTGWSFAKTSEVTALGNSWYRVTMFVTTGATTLFIGNCTANSDNTTNRADVGGGFGVNAAYIVHNADVELGAFPTPPVITTTAAATRAADNASITGLGPLLGQFRTNLLLHSNDFANAVWQKVALGSGVAPVLTAGFADPNGGLEATRIVFDRGSGTTGNDRSNINQDYGATSVYTSSIWLRADAPVPVSLRSPANTGGHTTINVTTAWQRFELYGTATLSSNFLLGLRGDLTANSTATVYVYGAQGETGPVATPYIPTTTAAVTVGNPFTMVSWGDLPAIDGTERYLAIARDAGGGLGNNVSLRRSSANAARMTVTNSGSAVAVSPPGAFAGALTIKSAGRVRVDGFATAANGSALASATQAAPAVLATLYLGININTQFLNGYLQRVFIYGDVGDAQLQRLTQ